jgi:hypothetical protein
MIGQVRDYEGSLKRLIAVYCPKLDYVSRDDALVKKHNYQLDITFTLSESGSGLVVNGYPIFIHGPSYNEVAKILAIRRIIQIIKSIGE